MKIYIIIKKIIKIILKPENILEIKKIYFNISGNFLIKKPVATKKYYLEKFKNYQNKIINDKFILDNFSKEETSFINDLALITQVTKKNSEINWMHGYVIVKELKNYILKNNDKKITVFETGTAAGFSAVIMSNILNRNNMTYEIFTIDIIPHNKPIY